MCITHFITRLYILHWADAVSSLTHTPHDDIIMPLTGNRGTYGKAIDCGWRSIIGGGDCLVLFPQCTVLVWSPTG